jgi:excinuclease ABC subunit A
MNLKKIIVKGARQHNLKNIDIQLPRNKIVVITGLSGSGKSTLAFDTLYAEGQRRYVESLSTYTRQFLERLEKPDVDLIEGLSPAIAIQQKAAGHNLRSTVGTVTEIYDYLRLLFAKIGRPHCHKCGRPIISQTLDQIVDQVMNLPSQSQIIIHAPLIFDGKMSLQALFKRLQKDGFSRVRLEDGRLQEIDAARQLKMQPAPQNIAVVIDRLSIKEKIRNRLADSLELGLSLSDGVIALDVYAPQNDRIDKVIKFSEKATCMVCNTSYSAFTPASFSFNSPQGACPQCDGLGSTIEFDPDLIVDKPYLSLRDGAVALWAQRSSVRFAEFLEALTSHYNVDIYTPYHDLPDKFKKVILYGSDHEAIDFYFEQNGRRITYRKVFEGLIPSLQRQYDETDTYQARKEIKRFMNFLPCPHCKGQRLNPASRAVEIGGKTISEITQFSITQGLAFLHSLKLTDTEEAIAGKVVTEIMARMEFLSNVGLPYLTLDRSTQTLSGGESQRIRLTTQIGSKLTGILYVLDEPTIGLHQRDNERLLNTLIKMKDLGNTVLVVEHDETTIKASDYVIDMGPGAGVHGGEIIFSGRPQDLIKDDVSLTGKYLSGRKQINIPLKRRNGSGQRITIKNAKKNNLKNIEVNIPLGCLVCVTGVSGSGKSTLILETLYQALSRKCYHTRIVSDTGNSVDGMQYVAQVVNIDHMPIGKSPRSNPGTYTGVFAFIRRLFAKTIEARTRGYKPGRFSFNIKGGRCEACKGEGTIKIEMHFLPDVYVTCDICKGKRYNRETLEIRYKGKSMADIMDLTVNQALKLFKNHPNIRLKLKTLADVGLGYITIGQPATTLSGGESQRIKLSRELSKRATGKTLYILDEPTTGLHLEDIKNLIKVLNRLIDAGNTVVVIEHNLHVIKMADHIIDLGPEGGEMGGYVVGCGTPEEIASLADSHTGKYLKEILPERQ